MLSHTVAGKMVIRKLAEQDAAAYWSLRLEALETEPFAFGMSAEEFAATSVESAAASIGDASGGSFFLGAFDAERLVASIRFHRETGLKERHKGHVFGAYVSASYRGSGLAGKLIAELVRSAKEDETLEQILLGVGTHNAAAIRTYRRLGFEVYGTEPRALKVGSEYVE